MKPVARRVSPWPAALALAAVLAVGTGAPGLARQGEPPRSWGDTSLAATDELPAVTLPTIDAAQLRALADATVEPGPYQVAEGVDVSIDLEHGIWEPVSGGRIWRVRIDAPGALHLNFGFGTLSLPEGAALHISSVADETAYVGPYGAADNTPNGLWTPMVPGASAVIELFVPDGAAEPLLELTRVGLGFVDLFGLDPAAKHELGACHIDVVCPQAFMDDEERAVARLLINNSGLCTGTLLNDVGGTRTPYILTADHCGITGPIAATVVALFNFKVATCGSGTPGPTTDTVSGSTLRATRTDVDGTLIELTSSPPAGYNAFLAGWDRSNTTPAGTTGIHHPQGTSMAFCEDTNAPTTVNNCIGGGGVNSHWRATWTLGTTLPGSSGSALFDRGSSKVIGHLSGGLAACNGSFPNGLWDCYGKLAVFWDGPSAASRLRDWLDPGNTGTVMVDGLENNPPGCVDDAFESNSSGGTDDTCWGTNLGPLPATQTHAHCDEDWVWFGAVQGRTYLMETENLTGGSDTTLALHVACGAQLLFDDDGGPGLASLLQWTANTTDFADLRLRQFANSYLPGEGYDISVSEICLADLVLTDQTISGPLDFVGDSTITTGPAFLVTTTGAATLTAGSSVEMLNDTTVEGELTVNLAPSPCPVAATVVVPKRGDEVGKERR